MLDSPPSPLPYGHWTGLFDAVAQGDTVRTEHPERARMAWKRHHAARFPGKRLRIDSDGGLRLTDEAELRSQWAQRLLTLEEPGQRLTVAKNLTETTMAVFRFRKAHNWRFSVQLRAVEGGVEIVRLPDSDGSVREQLLAMAVGDTLRVDAADKASWRSIVSRLHRAQEGRWMTQIIDHSNDMVVHRIEGTP